MTSGFQDFMHYDAALRQQADEIRIFGVPVTVYLPKDRSMQGYELELNPSLSSYQIGPSRCFIDFAPKRSVFYRHNWFPEGQESLVMVTFTPDTAISADAIIRTVDTVGTPSPYGDLLLKIVKFFDIGKYQVLQRQCFAKVMNDEQLWKTLTAKAART